jgi:hypothetical protein
MTTRREFVSDPSHRIRFIYLPKHSSWLDQIEIFFGIVQRKCLRGGNFTSVPELESQIREFNFHSVLWHQCLVNLRLSDEIPMVPARTAIVPVIGPRPSYPSIEGRRHTSTYATSLSKRDVPFPCRAVFANPVDSETKLR